MLVSSNRRARGGTRRRTKVDSGHTTKTYSASSANGLTIITSNQFMVKS